MKKIILTTVLLLSTTIYGDSKIVFDSCYCTYRFYPGDQIGVHLKGLLLTENGEKIIDLGRSFIKPQSNYKGAAELCKLSFKPLVKNNKCPEIYE